MNTEKSRDEKIAEKVADYISNYNCGCMACFEITEKRIKEIIEEIDNETKKKKSKNSFR